VDNITIYLFSPAAIVYADEVIRLARIFADGFDLTDASVGLDDIQTVGSAGNFLITDHTRQLFRQMPYQSRIWPSIPLDQWQVQGSIAASKMLKKHVIQLVGEIEAPADHGELLERGQTFINNDLLSRFE
jgi:trimethylamine:corrinoid methyltransferase-like protein